MEKLQDRHTFPPVGRCIYCGSTDDLTKEHIVPYSLRGTLILPKSSCRKCAKITNKFEDKVAQENHRMLHGYRRRYKLPSRRKHRDEVKAKIVLPDGTKVLKTFDAKTFPALLFGMRMPTPGILLGIEPSKSFYGTLVVSMPDPESAQIPDGVTTELGVFYSADFYRMLVKIAYAYAVPFYGTEGYHPMVLDIINGKTDMYPYLIGGYGAEYVEAKVDFEQVFDVRQIEVRKTVFLVVHVRLFANVGLPTYQVVLGDCAFK